MTHSFPTRRSPRCEHAGVLAERGHGLHGEPNLLQALFRLHGQGVVNDASARLDGFVERRAQAHPESLARHSHDVVAEIARRGLDVFSDRSEEHTTELQSLMSNSYADFCLKK